jgi:hypothetical protein
MGRKPYDRTSIRPRTLPAKLQPVADVLHESPAEALDSFLLDLHGREKITGGELAKYSAAVWSLAGDHKAAVWNDAGSPKVRCRTTDDERCQPLTRLVPWGLGVDDVDLACLETLAFDAHTTPQRTIPPLMVRALRCKDLGCDEAKAIQWIFEIRDRYNAANPYHNWRHAWDVFQFGALLAGSLHEALPPVDRLALLIAAAAHDVGHPGVTNAHLVVRSHPLALAYNDRSVLENFHAAVAFSAMRPERDFLPAALHKEVRGRVIGAILATDMAGHGAHIAALGSAEPPAVRTLVEALLHMADIGGCCRGWETQLRLGALLEEEFFRQGDEEARLGLPVQPLTNRRRDSFAIGQGFWIPNIVLPLVRAIRPFLEVGEFMEENCLVAEDTWAEMVNEYGDVTAGEIALRTLGFVVPRGRLDPELRVRGLAPWLGNI